MLSTSTHDSKRGEDTRACINVLSELPLEWRLHLARWSRINRRKKRVQDDIRMPSRNDEYLLYQTLLGTWPLAPLDAQALERFRARIEAYMLKAVREAKVHSSWINPNTAYEEAIRHFVQVLLHDPGRNAFLADFIPFQRRLVRYGLLNSLSQTLLKLTIPGVPDLYQGNELWCLHLVDPDNRRAVDYAQRQAQLEALMHASADGRRLPALLRQLLEQLEDGRSKLYLIWKTLELRRRHPALFRDGAYQELEAQGPGATHLCAFARRLQDQEVVVAVPRWFARLYADPGHLPLASPLWNDTWIKAPEDALTQGYRNLLTLETVHTQQCAQQHTQHCTDGRWFSAVDLFRCFPVALLINA